MSKPQDLVQGTLDLLILRLLAHEPLHGWAIGQKLTLVSNDVLQVSDGSLYPALHKLVCGDARVGHDGFAGVPRAPILSCRP